MDKAGDRHELTFHRGIDGVLNGLQTVETVDGSLTVHLDTGAVGHRHVEGVPLGLFTHHDGSFRSARGCFLGFLACIASALIVGILRVLFLFIPLFLRLHRKLLGLDLLLGHLHQAVETEVVTVTQEDMLVVVTVPVGREHRRNLSIGEVLLV